MAAREVGSGRRHGAGGRAGGHHPVHARHTRQVADAGGQEGEGRGAGLVLRAHRPLPREGERRRGPSSFRMVAEAAYPPTPVPDEPPDGVTVKPSSGSGVVFPATGTVIGGGPAAHVEPAIGAGADGIAALCQIMRG